MPIYYSALSPFVLEVNCSPMNLGIFACYKGLKSQKLTKWNELFLSHSNTYVELGFRSMNSLTCTFGTLSQYSWANEAFLISLSWSVTEQTIVISSKTEFILLVTTQPFLFAIPNGSYYKIIKFLVGRWCLSLTSDK